jgi:hypothetical protein
LSNVPSRVECRILESVGYGATLVSDLRHGNTEEGSKRRVLSEAREPLRTALQSRIFASSTSQTPSGSCVSYVGMYAWVSLLSIGEPPTAQGARKSAAPCGEKELRS